MTAQSFKNSYWARSGVYTIGYRMGTLIFGFGSFYFLIRHLSQFDFGVWALFSTIVTVIEMSRSGLIRNGLIKLLSVSEPSEANKIITASWFVSIAFSSLIFLLLMCASSFLARIFETEEISTMFLQYGVIMILLVPLSQFNYLQQSKLSFSGIFWSTITRQGSFFLFVLFIYLTDSAITLVQLVQAQIVCTALGAICAYYCARKFVQASWEFDWTFTKKVFRFGKYVMGTNLCSLLYKSMDQISIGYFLSANFVAIYNSAIRMSNLVEYPGTAISEVVYPKSALRTSQEGDKVVKSLYEKSVGFTLAITVPVIFVTILLADYIILVIAGPAYATAADILRVTMLFGFFTAFTRQFGTVMDSSGRPKENFQLLFVSLLVNIVSNYIFIKYFGVIGAAYGTLVSYIIFTIIGYVILVRLFQVELSKVFGYMISYYAASLAFMRKTIKLKLGVG